MRTSILVVAAAFTTGVLVSGPVTAVGAARDPAERGLDVFIHAPSSGLSGGRLAVQVRVYGFPSVAALAPLGQARVEAVWDATSLGPHAPPPDPPVVVVTDNGGRAQLEVAIPRGPKDDELKLLLSARWHDHQRTREVTIKRKAAHTLELRVSDTAVVPGGALSGWVIVRDAVSGLPVAGTPVDLELKEGTTARFTRRLTTDRSGMAAAQVPVPLTDDPDWRWTLTGSTAFPTGDNADARVELRVREEIPAMPALSVRWAEPAVRPGARTTFVVGAHDGAGAALILLPLRYWVGARGTDPPSDDTEWQRASTAAVTDREGAVTVPIDTPSTISPRGGGLTVVVRATVEGRPLSATDALTLETPRPTLELTPEFGALVPGQTQRLFIHLTNGKDPLSTELMVEGHALAARVRTNERGWAETTWTVPRDVGAYAPSEKRAGCADEVAATVRVRPLVTPAALRPIEECVRVDRDATGAVRPARAVVRAGEALPIHVVGGQTTNVRTPEATSVIAQTPAETASAGAWIAAGTTIRVPASARGVWSISAAEPRTGAIAKGARTAALLPGTVLVLPRVLPALTARRADGALPSRGGFVEIEAELTDGHGTPLTGSVGAVVIDKQGGAHPENLLALDTRRALAAELNVPADDVAGFLDGDTRYEAQRWAAVANAEPHMLAPVVDPAATLNADIDKVFGSIVRSLEGGVFQSSGDPEHLQDVRIHTGGGFALNPEMLTLTTEAMETPPTTPGGEPWRLSDLMAIDPQVRYDVVARRVTRLKLFHVLDALRTYLYENHLGPDEPALRDPNALLRRLVRTEALGAADLLDPWAHGLAFVRAPGPRVPFLSLVPGYRLQSAGPDGRHGTADDVRDPFQRVLRANTPYARAVEEDRLVDAKWDMRVGDDTVEAWKETLTALTGSELGDQEAIGVGGLGTVGSGGGGYGRGAGGLGGRRASEGVEVGPAIWLPPARTDERGHLRLKVPLGTAETTWQILLVAVPDGGSPAVTSLDVPVSAPLSVAVTTGESWIAGDQVGVAVSVRNRTDRRLAASLRVAASGVAALADPKAAARALELPPHSTTPAVVYVRAMRAGTGIVEATISAAGVQTDTVRHQWQVNPAAERTVATVATWIEGDTTAAFAKEGAAPGLMPAGPGQLILERGVGPALAAALESLQPERLIGLRAVADALEIFARVRTWALQRGGETDKLAVRATELAALAMGRQKTYAERAAKRPHADGESDETERAHRLRAALWEPATAAGRDEKKSDHQRAGRPACPPRIVAALPAKLDWLEVTQPSAQGSERACWVAFESSALQQLAATNDPLLLARTLLAVLDRASSTVVTGALAERLRAAAPVRADGTFVLPPALANDRAAQAIVMAGHIRARGLGHAGPATAAGAATVAARLALQRDAHGGYGSAQATRAVVRALLDMESRATTPSASPIEVRWSEQLASGSTGTSGRASLRRGDTTVITLGASATAVRLQAAAPGVLARLVRPSLRPFASPVDPTASPLSLQLDAPTAARAGATAALQVSVRHGLGRTAGVVVRIPLPPGAALAETVDGVRQVQGVLYVRPVLGSDPLPRVFTIPLRFALAGSVTLPEATARIDDEEWPAARTPARPLSISK